MTLGCRTKIDKTRKVLVFLSALSPPVCLVRGVALKTRAKNSDSRLTNGFQTKSSVCWNPGVSKRGFLWGWLVRREDGNEGLKGVVYFVGKENENS